MMRFSPLAFVVAAVAPAIAVVACASQEQRTAPSVPAPPGPPPSVETSQEAPAPAPEYVLAESAASARPMTTLVLGPPDAHGDEPKGVLLGGARLVTHGASYSLAKSVAEPPVIAAYKVPKRFGGGFVFRSTNTLYTSPTFDGTLTPLVSTATDIVDVSFAPRSLFVHGSGGQRWAIELATGKRVALSPFAVAEVAALDDGRAAAIDLGGHALVSTDAGATWKDVTSSLHGALDHIAWDDSSVSFIVNPTNGGSQAVHVEAGGRLAPFVILPAPPAKHDPRWRNVESPIHRAVRLGASLDDGTAIVEADGDVFRIDAATGAIRSDAAGHLPPDATCEAVRVSDDVVLVCVGANRLAFVASHTVGDKVPTIEQTFGVAGSFTMSDDGAIAFAGPCNKAQASRSIVCVRSAAGGWQEFDLSSTVPDGGAPYDVSRWLPRGDGSALGIVAGQTPGIVDARTGDFRAWTTNPNGSQPSRPALGYLAQYRNGGVAPNATILDRTASLTSSGTVRIWGGSGESYEITLDGESTQSPFHFDRVAFAGPFALARQNDGRVWQSLDRGASWAEVQGPVGALAGAPSLVRSCTSVGCDLGDWYRVGWSPTAPAAILAPEPAASAPIVGGVPAPKLSCTPSAPVKRSALPRGEKSPDDIGLGLNRLAVGDEKGTTGYVRTLYSRIIVSPANGAVDTAADDGAARALLHGFATINADDGHMVQQGPTKSLSALRRDLTYVAPFDPLGIVRKTTFAASDALSAMRAAGAATTPDAIAVDPAMISSMVPMTPTDPSVPDGLAFACDTGVVGEIAAKTRVAFLPSRADDSRPISAVLLDATEFALLLANSSGQERVVKSSAAGAVGVFDVQPPPSSYGTPINVDAIAVGPKGELGVIRTPSGSEPSSELDPAIVITQNAPAAALAPWSTLTPDDDAACKSDPSGWRATIQTSAPWIILSGADVASRDDAPMFVRVRWGTTRVCLEAVEVRSEDLQLVSPTGVTGPSLGLGFGQGGGQASFAWDGPIENWIVARMSGGAVAGRVGITPGVELRQPFTCTLTPP
jgi:hypothetical protein